MTAAKVTVVGGGVHVASLVARAAERSDLPALDVHLVAQDASRLSVIGRHVAAVVRRTRPDWTLHVTTDLAGGARDADAIVLLVRVGGSGARDHDERFPGRWGLVGDEGLGAGGIANAWRTVPVLSAMAPLLLEVSPGALVLNMVAPLGITTRVLTEAGVRTLGVCELPTAVVDALVAAGGDDASMSVGGLNHLSWVWPTDATDPSSALRLLEAGLAAKAVDRSTFAHFGGVPMPYYYRVVDQPAGRTLGIEQPVGRARQLASLSQRALDRMAAEPGTTIVELAERPTPWFDLATVPVLAAWLGGRPWTGTGNVRNDGLLEELDEETVVEVPVNVAAGCIEPRSPGRPPPPIAEFLAGWARVEDLTYRAAKTHDHAAVERAIRSLPLDIPAAGIGDLARSVVDGERIPA